MNQIKEILSKKLSDEYLDVVSGNNFPWFFYNDIAVEKDPDSGLNLPTKFGFSHTPFFEGNVQSPYFDYFMPGIIEMVDKFDTSINRLLRIRLGLQTRNDNKKTLYLPHVDYEFDHKVILYYFNSSDGDTIMYKEKIDPDNYTGYPNKYTEEIRNTPEQNSAIFFDGKTFHAYESPVENSARFVMNVVFE
jgi:hypothetical protein